MRRCCLSNRGDLRTARSFTMTPRTRSPATPTVVAGAGIALTVAAATAIAVSDDEAGKTSLDALGPLVEALSAVGGLLIERPWLLLDLVGTGLIVALAVTVSVMWRRRDTGAARVTTSAALALAGQLLLLHRSAAWGTTLCVLALVFALTRQRRERTEPWSSQLVSGAEAAALLVVIVVAVGFRFFTLNRVVHYFEGELSPYLVGAADLQGMLLANTAIHGPWAPLGLLFYLPIHLAVSYAGTTVLAVRLASAAIGVATIVAAFLLARTVAGRSAGLTASLLLALDPLQIGWSRSDVHPHGVTAWPALLLAWATLRAIETRATGWFVALTVLMGLSWHQYPSGQPAMLIPPLVLLIHAATHRGFARSVGWRWVLVALGLGAWSVGYSVVHWLGTGRLAGLGHYFHLLGPRVAAEDPAVTPSLLRHAVDTGADLVKGIYVEIPHLFHQTFIPEIDPSLPLRALPWLVAAFTVVGAAILLARLPSPRAVVMVVSVLCAVIPAALSDIAYVKRAAVLYPLLAIVAAVGIAALLAAVGASLGPRAMRTAVALLLACGLGWTAISSHLWFSGHRYPWGTPPEVVIADAVGRQLRPTTVVITNFWDDYMPGKFTYLLLDDLRREELQPLVWYVTTSTSDDWPTLIAYPHGAVNAVFARPWYLLWSGLDESLRRIQVEREWRRVVYLIQEDEQTGDELERIRALCPLASVRRFHLGDESKHRMWLAVCDDHPDFLAP
jgi:hypothetical protein